MSNLLYRMLHVSFVSRFNNGNSTKNSNHNDTKLNVKCRVVGLTWPSGFRFEILFSVLKGQTHPNLPHASLSICDL